MSRFDEPAGEQPAVQQESSGIGQSVREVGGQVRDVAQEQISHLKETASEYYQQGRDMAMQWEQNMEDYVREQPVRSLLIAAGVGLLLGILWRRS